MIDPVQLAVDAGALSVIVSRASSALRSATDDRDQRSLRRVIKGALEAQVELEILRSRSDGQRFGCHDCAGSGWVLGAVCASCALGVSR